MCVRLYLPLSLIHLMLQALQVGQEGLVELRQLGLLPKTWPELRDNTTICNVRTRRIQLCNIPA